MFLLDTQKEPKRCPLLPIAREARPRGCSPLGTPKMWSTGPKAKKCRSAAFFLTLLPRSPYCPLRGQLYSTTHSVGADARHRPAPGSCLFTFYRKGGFHIRPMSVGCIAPVGASTARPLLFALFRCFRATNGRPYLTCSLICRGRRPRRPATGRYRIGPYDRKAISTPSP